MSGGGIILIIALGNAKHELVDMRDKIVELGSALRIEDLARRVAELEQENELRHRREQAALIDAQNAEKASWAEKSTCFSSQASFTR